MKLMDTNMIEIILFLLYNMSLVGCFYFFLFMGVVVSSYFSILSVNPIYSVLFLVLVYFLVGLIFFLMEVEFLGVVILMIYMGAISVLFLFVIMMLDMKFIFYNYLFLDYFLFFFFLVIFFLFELFFFFKFSFFFDFNYFYYMEYNFIFFNFLDWLNTFYYGKLMNLLGVILYNFYFIYFLFSSLLLLVSMIGSIILTLDVDFMRLGEFSTQSMFSQVYSFYPEIDNFYVYYSKKY